MALCTLDTTDCAIVRLVVDYPEVAERVLRDKRCAFTSAPVLAIEMTGEHELKKITCGLVQAEINIHHYYPFLFRPNGRYGLVMRVEDLDLAEDVLRRHGLTVLHRGDIAPVRRSRPCENRQSLLPKKFPLRRPHWCSRTHSKKPPSRRASRASPRFLSNLLDARSPTGHEFEAQAVIEKHIRPVADDFAKDTLGNRLATINPKGSTTLMFAGHIDEIALTVAYIDDRGFLYFEFLGGHDNIIPSGRRVEILTKNGPVLGITGKRAVHLMSPKMRKKVLERHEMWIDIGVEKQGRGRAARPYRRPRRLQRILRNPPRHPRRRPRVRRQGRGLHLHGGAPPSRRRPEGASPPRSSPSPPRRRKSGCAARRSSARPCNRTSPSPWTCATPPTTRTRTTASSVRFSLSSRPRHRPRSEPEPSRRGPPRRGRRETRPPVPDPV